MRHLTSLPEGEQANNKLDYLLAANKVLFKQLPQLLKGEDSPNY